MAIIKTKSAYLIRRDTADNWADKNPVLRQGEQGYETDTKRLKIGDGVTAWNSLAYFATELTTDEEIRLNGIYANALNGAKSATAVRLDDISPNKHDVIVKVRGKNLVSPPQFTTKTNNGITYTVNSDGTITANGTVTGAQQSQAFLQNAPNGIPADPNTCYMASAGLPTEMEGVCRVDYLLYKGNTLMTSVSVSSTAKTIYLPHIDYDNIACKLYIKGVGTEVDNLVFKPQIEIGTIATAYAPHISDMSNIKVAVSGKNLIPYPYAKTSFSNNGITYTVNSDGTITANGTFTDVSKLSYVTITANLKKLPIGNTFTISGAPYIPGATTQVYYCNTSNGKTLDGAVSSDGTNKTFTTATDAANPAIQLSIKSKGTLTTIENWVFKPQIEVGLNGTEYEPYQSTEYTPTDDGMIEGLPSVSPDTTFIEYTESALIDCEYNKDINKVFSELQQAILSLGGDI